MQVLSTAELKNVKLPTAAYKISMPWEKAGEPKSVEQELDRKRIAVLPFANISPDPKDEYFADGMTEELISVLASIAELTVIARTSVMRYKGASEPVDEIGRDLKVGTVLEGSVRKAGERFA